MNRTSADLLSLRMLLNGFCLRAQRSYGPIMQKVPGQRCYKGQKNKFSCLGHPLPEMLSHEVACAIDTPSMGSFSPFPHGTRTLSDRTPVAGFEGGPPNFLRGGGPRSTHVPFPFVSKEINPSALHDLIHSKLEETGLAPHWLAFHRKSGKTVNRLRTLLSPLLRKRVKNRIEQSL